MKENLPDHLSVRYKELITINKRFQSENKSFVDQEGQLLYELEREMLATEYVCLGFIDKCIGKKDNDTFMIEMSISEFSSFYHHVNTIMSSSKSDIMQEQYIPLRKKVDYLLECLQGFVDHGMVW